MRFKKAYRLVLLVFLLPLLVHADLPASIQSQIDANQQKIEALKATIASYQKQLDQLGTEKNTLQSTINILTISQKKLESQMQVTQNQIASANLHITELTSSIGNKEEIISDNQAAIAKALRVVAQDEQPSLVTSLMNAQSITEAWKAADETVQFNRALTKDIADLQDARKTLSDNRDKVSTAKASLVALQAQLKTQNKSIAATKAKQQQLLKQTKNSEASYQKLLAAARAELAAFTAFTTAAGGSKLLANQTVCDSWGCYYNQRDTLWGSMRLNGAQDSLAAAGCLVTSMAMVLTHYGHKNVTPISINSNPANFSAVGGLMLFTTYVDGVTATRVAATIDATLATGNPVIVGIHAYGGTHFVVLTSGSRGSYLMRDPYIPNAKDINFTDHYSLGSIYAVNKVIVSS